MLVPFEERPWLRAPLEALDQSRFAAYYERRYGHPLAHADIPYERLVQNLKLVADETNALHPTVLGLLLSCSDPQTYLGGAFVDIAVYDSEHPDANHQRDAKKITGTLPEQIGKCVEYLRLSPFVPVAASKNELGRKDYPAYSLRALQEAVVNAVVHRDYQLAGSQVRLFLFPNRIEISSPGGLHNTIRPEDLYAGCQPYRRNQLLAGFLRDYQSPLTGRAYMEARGEGFLMLVRESEQISGRRPDLQAIGDSVRLTIYAGGRTP
jgi:predicted HTH transcriptional regulator